MPVLPSNALTSKGWAGLGQALILHLPPWWQGATYLSPPLLPARHTLDGSWHQEVTQDSWPSRCTTVGVRLTGVLTTTPNACSHISILTSLFSLACVWQTLQSCFLISALHVNPITALTSVVSIGLQLFSQQIPSGHWLTADVGG